MKIDTEMDTNLVKKCQNSIGEFNQLLFQANRSLIQLYFQEKQIFFSMEITKIIISRD